jgi:hypothetical protein
MKSYPHWRTPSSLRLDAIKKNLITRTCHPVGVEETTMRRSSLVVALGIAAGFTGINAANAAPVSVAGVFTMYSPAGFDTSGSMPGSTPINIDTTITAFVDQAAGTWGVASTAPFYGLTWTASNGQLILGAGTYNLNAGTGTLTSAGSCTVANDGNICFTIGTNQVAGMIDFAWGYTSAIRVVNVWNIGASGALIPALAPGMENGPLPGFNAAFCLATPSYGPPEGPPSPSSPCTPTSIPLPASAWLLGSGLMGLLGAARRKKV